MLFHSIFSIDIIVIILYMTKLIPTLSKLHSSSVSKPRLKSGGVAKVGELHCPSIWLPCTRPMGEKKMYGPRTASSASISLRNFPEVQMYRPHPELLNRFHEGQPSNLCFENPSRWWVLKFENCRSWPAMNIYMQMNYSPYHFLVHQV